MSFDSVRVAFVTRLNAWTDAPIVWDGHKVTDEAKAAKAAYSPWCRVTIQDGDRTFATQDNTALAAGTLFVQVFTRDGEGPDAARDLADSLAAHLDDYTAGALVCDAASVGNAGPGDGWYQINVSVPWRVYQ
ncbi:MAG: phage tail terminator-like protein [Halomonas sp.]|nr:phage tail terminator-like protein [Halomonas sp.]